MHPAQPIDHLEVEFKYYDHMYINAAGNPRILPMDGFFIYAVVNDPRGLGNYYRWQSDGIFEFFSLTDNPNIKQCWAPVPRLESSIDIIDDMYTDGKQFRQLICIVPYDRPTQYLVKIRQQSLTERAHEFWATSLAQQVNSGSLFDPPPSPIHGNVANVNDENDRALGFFGASAIFPTSLLLERFKEAGMVPPARAIPIRPGDCRNHELGATNIKPPGFN